MSPATTRVGPRRAMVLAAGLGTRMRPLTDSTPKPLVKVAGKPLIDHVLDRLADAGVERAVVNVHHLAEHLQRHLAHRQSPKIVISDERGLLLGTGGGVKKALAELGNVPFFHVNSDTIWIDGVKSNLLRLAEFFRPCRNGCAFAAGTYDRQRRLFRARRFLHGTRWQLAQANRAGGRALRLRRGGDTLACFVQGRAERRVLADCPVRTCRARKAATWSAPRRRVDACWYPRGHCRSGSRDSLKRRLVKRN